jgi:hypothetical protein
MNGDRMSKYEVPNILRAGGWLCIPSKPDNKTIDRLNCDWYSIVVDWRILCSKMLTLFGKEAFQTKEGEYVWCLTAKSPKVLYDFILRKTRNLNGILQCDKLAAEYIPSSLATRILDLLIETLSKVKPTPYKEMDRNGKIVGVLEDENTYWTYAQNSSGENHLDSQIIDGRF